MGAVRPIRAPDPPAGLRLLDRHRPPGLERDPRLLPNTLWLVGLSTVITVALGLWLGARRGGGGGTFDKVSTGSSMVLYAMPEFWLGMLLLVFLGARTGWFPTGGVRDVTGDPSGIDALIDRLHHLFLPTLTLVLAYLGSYSLIMRSSILETVRGLPHGRPGQGPARRRHASPRRPQCLAALRLVDRDRLRLRHRRGHHDRDGLQLPGLGLASDAIKNNDLAMLQALFFCRARR